MYTINYLTDLIYLVYLIYKTKDKNVKIKIRKSYNNRAALLVSIKNKYRLVIES